MLRGAFVLLLGVAFAVPARAEVKLDNAWLRPVAAGQKQAAVYVDIASDEPLDLVGASSPWAKRAELVAVDAPAPDAPQRVVAAMRVGRDGLRLAYLGSHVRLVDVLRDAGAGEQVDVELVFAAPDGSRRTVRTQALVRGLGLRFPDAPAPSR